MIWAAMLLLALAAMVPLVAMLFRPVVTRGRREADLALYRAQLAELDREAAAGRLEGDALRAAQVEVQRRLLQAPEEAAPMVRGRALGFLPLVFLIPAAGLGLYLLQGTPDMPSAPHRERAELAARDDALLNRLRERLAGLDPMSDAARQGYVMLGNAERSRGNADAAAEAWRRALASRFDVELAGDLVEMEIGRGEFMAAGPILLRALAEAPQEPKLRFLLGVVEAEAGQPERARATWRALLADSPPDAPWRALVERRLGALP
jgi:cytochrome c-type biogenesis protein CcmH